MSGERPEKRGEEGTLALLGQQARPAQSKGRPSREAKLDGKFAAKKRAWERCGGAVATAHDLYLGDARMMREALPDTQVHLVVTSPPYWNLKEYAGDGADAQLGHIDDRRRV